MLSICRYILFVFTNDTIRACKIKLCARFRNAGKQGICKQLRWIFCLASWGGVQLVQQPRPKGVEPLYQRLAHVSNGLSSLPLAFFFFFFFLNGFFVIVHHCFVLEVLRNYTQESWMHCSFSTERHERNIYWLWKSFLIGACCPTLFSLLHQSMFMHSGKRGRSSCLWHRKSSCRRTMDKA